MDSGDQNLTHDEIWDDRALVNSWNDALEEYKKYHSIHSKGGNVDDLVNPEKTATSDAKDGNEDSELPSSRDAVDCPDVGSANGKVGKDNYDGDKVGNPDTQHSLPAERAACIPAPLLGSVRDEGLKKLLMSWYYAGYYTGLYEGQREHQQ
ncbi:SMN family protein Smn1 [Pseudomassariella vexata]|uniref:SMN family protein Smn1 n=1 Tax=Pseudomassariella vexata TaxID=1141098 RepID=A0A1Y2DY03_9PEZI|nr:SMN family protein Smn1 [Pseudomassariella vexata]ORY64089.1 SMN family protein Smn1 [Pseudomassariella vexata]